VKRILTTATAILALGAGPALAMDEMAEGPSLSFSGKAQMGMIYTGDTETKTGTVLSKGGITWNAEMDIGIAAEGVTDTGLTFGVSTNINAEVGSAAGAKTIAAAAGSGDEVETPDVYIGGEIWKITVGTPDKASELAFSLNDIGYEGLGVDDVAENLGKLPGDAITTGRAAYANTGALNAGQVRVDLTLGAATVAISAGQTAGKARVAGKAASWSHVVRFATALSGGDKTPAMSFSTSGEGNHEYNARIELPAASQPGTTMAAPPDTNKVSDPVAGDRFYRIGNTLYRVKGMPDQYQRATADDPIVISRATGDTMADEVVVKDLTALKDADGDTITGTHLEIVQSNTEYVAAVKKVDATKPKTNWAAGVTLPVGPAKLGFGVDSEKALMASVGADLGMINGSVFYGQREISNTVKPKSVGLEVGFAAGEGTTINAVVSQYDPDMATNNQKLQGFGVGVSHDLGGGAKVQAGFAKVDGLSGATHTFVDGQTKASVGVTMAF